MERGKCNSNELYRIIEKIQPEIIFAELPYDVFEIIYTEGRRPTSGRFNKLSIRLNIAGSRLKSASLSALPAKFIFKRMSN